MAHRNKRGVSRIEFNKRIRDLVSRDTNKLRQTFDKFDKEHASRMAEIYSMQEKMRHAMRSLAIDKKNAQETSDRAHRLGQEHEDRKTSLQHTGGSQRVRAADGRKIPRLSVGSYPVGASLDVRASGSERRHSLPVYQITNFTTPGNKQQQQQQQQQQHARDSAQSRRASQQARQELPQFPANFGRPATHAALPRENYSQGSANWALNDPFPTKLRTKPPRLSVSGPPVNASRRIPQAHSSSPPLFQARSLDEDNYIGNETKNQRATQRRPRSTSLCHGLQSVITIETDYRRLSDSGVREVPERRRFSVPSNSAPSVNLYSKPSSDVNDGQVRRSHTTSPAIPIPGAGQKDSVDGEAILDDLDELEHQ